MKKYSQLKLLVLVIFAYFYGYCAVYRSPNAIKNPFSINKAPSSSTTTTTTSSNDAGNEEAQYNSFNKFVKKTLYLDRVALFEQETSVQNIIDQLYNGYVEVNSNSSLKRCISLKKSVAESHCPRPQAYKKGASDKGTNTRFVGIDISSLRKLIRLESSSGEVFADVGASINMNDLVDSLLPLGFIPAIVPEFRGITVGGSIQGLAAETASFRHGLYHDAVRGFELLLSNGTKVWCSKDSNSDLFYGVPGSFGSIGICTRAEIKCIPAKSYVKLITRKHKCNVDCVEYMKKLVENTLSVSDDFNHNLQFLEGIGYNYDFYLSIRGNFLTSDEVVNSKLKVKYCNSLGTRWFYNIAKEYHRKHATFPHDDSTLNVGENESAFVMPTKDYLFRHDRGSFWMASYRIPQIVGRWIMGPLLDSSNMFKLANALPWAFPKKVIVLQDFMLPINRVSHFIDQIQAELNVWPLWLLPMRNMNHKKEESAIFSIPNPTGTQKDIIHFCNVGAYGIPGRIEHYDFIPSNKKLEQLLFENQGRKVYYSHSFYDRDFFYNTLYDGARYFSLRKQYVSDSAFPEIYDKITTVNNQL